VLLSDYISDVRLLIHDPNASDFTDATLTGFINQGRTRVALDTQCVQTYFSGLNTIARQEIYPLTGFVGGAIVTAGGANYTNPTISISGGGGTGAAASAVVQNGVIIAVNMTNWGTGYGSVPTYSVTDPSGSGATLFLVVGFNIINWLQPLDILWGSLRMNFDYLPFMVFNTYARAYQLLFSRPGCFTVHLGNQQVFVYPIPDQAYPMAITASIVPLPLINPPDLDTQVIAPWNDAVKLYAAHLCYSSLQNLDMANFYYSGLPQNPGKYDLRVRQLPASVTPYRVPNPYAVGRRRVRRM
jgi:hypothetical protein